MCSCLILIVKCITFPFLAGIFKHRILTNLCCLRPFEINVSFSADQRLFLIENWINSINILCTMSQKKVTLNLHSRLPVKKSATVLSELYDSCKKYIPYRRLCKSNWKHYFLLQATTKSVFLVILHVFKQK